MASMYQIKAIKCGKRGCRKCPHPGYVYRYFKQDGKTRSEYLGKVENIDFDKLLKIEEEELYLKYGSIWHSEEKKKALDKILLQIESMKTYVKTHKNS
jgi:hypothetical protein